MKKIMTSTVGLLVSKIWWLGLAVILLLSGYWGFVASDRYVSSANVVLQSPDIAPPELSLSSMISAGSSGNRGDLLLLREHMLSIDMLKKLDQKLDLRHHFSQGNIDYFSRLSSPNLPIEYFHQYYLDRINVHLDDYSGTLIVEASAFSPDIAYKIVQLLLKFGERHMNEMGQRLASEQLAFIEKQVLTLSERLIEANNAVLKYQNKEGLLSPSDTALSMSTIIAKLNADLIGLKAQRKALSSFQSSRSPEMRKLQSQIDSLEQQVRKEQSKLTSQKGEALNQVSLEYESLKLKAQFAQELYANSLATLEATRVEAARKLKQVSVLAEPNMPEYSIEPNRSYLIAVSILLTLLATLLLNMVFTVIKDHRD